MMKIQCKIKLSRLVFYDNYFVIKFEKIIVLKCNIQEGLEKKILIIISFELSGKEEQIHGLYVKILKLLSHDALS